MNIDHFDIIVVGSGLSGITMAERFAKLKGKRVLIIEKRNHIGGNCFDAIDNETNIRMNHYGAHLFHTNDDDVYRYVQLYSDWVRWEHQVLGLVDKNYVSIPPNITTVNKLCNENINSEQEMKQWLAKHQIKYDFITNSEELAKSRIGETLYDKLIKHYTFKQWGCYPEKLSKEVLARIPLRTDFDTRYFTDRYQMLPKNGYTNYFEQVLKKNPLISISLDTDFFTLRKKIKKQTIIYTGPIDLYFSQKGFAELEYRSLTFDITKIKNCSFYQPNSVVNYPGTETPYTRCVEYKHFLNQNSDHTLIVKEKSTSQGEPYYPVLNQRNLDLYTKYQALSKKEPNVHFIGRLASYKYFNMDQAIKNALDYFNKRFV